MFLSLVRPDRISSPMTRTAAVTMSALALMGTSGGTGTNTYALAAPRSSAPNRTPGTIAPASAAALRRRRQRQAPDILCHRFYRPLTAAGELAVRGPFRAAENYHRNI